MNSHSYEKYVIGIDFGTSSARCLVLHTKSGETIATADSGYPKFDAGLYCDPSEDVYRQHPDDYMFALKECVTSALASLSREQKNRIVAVTIDTTGSTPCPVDEMCTPLSLHDDYSDDPDAMFILWKDHSAGAEAQEITEIASHQFPQNYLRFNGGEFSPEWYWAKVLHAIRTRQDVRERACTWLEHSDWIPALLTGERNCNAIKRNRCGAALKALWNPSFGGYPPAELFAAIDQRLPEVLSTLGEDSFTADQPVGTITQEWSTILGIPRGAIIGVGVFDAHTAAIGAGVSATTLVRTMGTSASDMAVTASVNGNETVYSDVEGQAIGSIIPGMIGIESGQSAFGDILEWVVNVFSPEDTEKIERTELKKRLSTLMNLAAKREPTMDHPVALDWHAGRRSPGINHKVRSVIDGLSLGVSSVDLFRAHILGLVFGARRIHENLHRQGLRFQRIRAVGGVAQRMPIILQYLANTLQLPIELSSTDQASARGAAILASVVAGVFKSTEEAITALQADTSRVFVPDPARTETYNILYNRYVELAEFANGRTRG